MADTEQAQETTAKPEPNLELPAPVARRGVTEAQWRTLCNSLFPGADPQSVLMVVDYCQARSLDMMKKPCHIVPMQVKMARSSRYEWVDVVMPGIYEYRMTAHRTDLYLGHTVPEYGPPADQFGVKAPEWCSMTFKRKLSKADPQVIDFPVKVYFSEVVVLKDGKANSRWTRAPIQMLTKCTEAAGLREAFPGELGGEHTMEEMEGRQIERDVTPDDQRPEIEMPRRKAADPDLIIDQRSGVTLVSVEEVPYDDNEGTWWHIKDSADHEYGTDDSEMGEQCKKFMDAKTPVVLNAEKRPDQDVLELLEVMTA